MIAPRLEAGFPGNSPILGYMIQMEYFTATCYYAVCEYGVVKRIQTLKLCQTS